VLVKDKALWHPVIIACICLQLTDRQMLGCAIVSRRFLLNVFEIIHTLYHQTSI